MSVVSYETWLVMKEAHDLLIDRVSLLEEALWRAEKHIHPDKSADAADDLLFVLDVLEGRTA